MGFWSYILNSHILHNQDIHKHLRIGTKFLASVKVCQKTFTKTGLPKGQPYLLADIKTITQLDD